MDFFVYDAGVTVPHKTHFPRYCPVLHCGMTSSQITRSMGTTSPYRGSRGGHYCSAGAFEANPASLQSGAIVAFQVALINIVYRSVWFVQYSILTRLTWGLGGILKGWKRKEVINWIKGARKDGKKERRRKKERKTEAIECRKEGRKEGRN